MATIEVKNYHELVKWLQISKLTFTFWFIWWSSGLQQFAVKLQVGY